MSVSKKINFCWLQVSKSYVIKAEKYGFENNLVMSCFNTCASVSPEKASQYTSRISTQVKLINNRGILLRSCICSLCFWRQGLNINEIGKRRGLRQQTGMSVFCPTLRAVLRSFPVLTDLEKEKWCPAEGTALESGVVSQPP